MRYQKRMNKYERAELNKQKLEKAIQGDGLYLFENNSDAELWLPKVPQGRNSSKIGAREQFKGDSYFLRMVQTHDLKLIETIQDAKGVQMKEQKLILDQPDIVTAEGTVEHKVMEKNPVVTQKTVKETKFPTSVLLTEDPLDGVDILSD